MIYRNNEELQNLHIGDKEIQRVLLSESLIWENNKVVKLGAGTSWNIRNLYPNLYSQLTADNFFFLTFNSVSTSVVVNVSSGGSERLYIYGGLSKSYNPSTGILTFYPYLNSNSASLTAVMVSKPLKLTYLGRGTSFNLRSLFPTKYMNFTANNFIVKGMSHYNGGGMTGLVCNEVRNYAGRYDAGDTLSFIKSYNATTGVLSIYANDYGNTDSNPYWNRSSSVDVYVTEKAL